MIHVPPISNFIDLADAPHSYFGAANKAVTVNVTASGLEFTTPSGGGITFETPTGTIDGSNTAFTVTNTPKYIVIDGAQYFSGQGYSIVGLNITTDFAPTGFIRSAY